MIDEVAVAEFREFLREQGVELEKTDYRVLDAFRIVINSPVFLEK